MNTAMNTTVVTLDLDWAPEAAIEDTLNFLENQQIVPTVFATHRSPRIEAVIDDIEVGLHPFFDSQSSHGSSISQVVQHVMSLPHNIAAYRCHRFANCNQSKQEMAEAGMLISSNVCTDLEIVAPFRDRFGLVEVPIFMEDGGYLWRRHPLEMNEKLYKSLQNSGIKVIIIHPMHFAINTPNFEYMVKIKQSVNREQWNHMDRTTLQSLRWPGRGIRTLIQEILNDAPHTAPLGKTIFSKTA